MGNTTVVCGVKAEISEPELDRDGDGFLGIFNFLLLHLLSLLTFNGRLVEKKKFQTLIFQPCVLQHSNPVHQLKKLKFSRIDLTKS